jgi:hypothetical protein
MIQMTEVTGRMRRKADNKKLTRVLSTKLSIEDYDHFMIYTRTAYSQGIIDEPKPSTFLQYIATVPFERLHDNISYPSSPTSVFSALTVAINPSFQQSNLQEGCVPGESDSFFCQSLHARIV